YSGSGIAFYNTDNGKSKVTGRTSYIKTTDKTCSYKMVSWNYKKNIPNEQNTILNISVDKKLNVFGMLDENIWSSSNYYPVKKINSTDINYNDSLQIFNFMTGSCPKYAYSTTVNQAKGNIGLTNQAKKSDFKNILWVSESLVNDVLRDDTNPCDIDPESTMTKSYDAVSSSYQGIVDVLDRGVSSSNFAKSLKDATTVFESNISAYKAVGEDVLSQKCLTERPELSKKVEDLIKTQNADLTTKQKELDNRLKNMNLSSLNPEDKKSVEDAISGAISSITSASNLPSIIINGPLVKADCGILSDELVKLLNDLWLIVEIISPLILIVTGAMDFVKATALDDKDALKKAVSIFLKRCVVVVVIFLLPYLINLILSLPGLEAIGGNGTCGVGKQ
ncbi:MAG: hypothetical protein RSE91_01875, partial [Bacilli bacterium]